MASGTRASTSTGLAAVIGKPGELPLADLPTKRNVLQKMLQLRLPDTRYVRHIPVSDLAGTVASMVQDLWLRVNHHMERSMVSNQEIKRKIIKLWKTTEEISYGGKKKISGKKRAKAEERDAFLTNLDRLFDVCVCQCRMQSCSDLDCPPECPKRVHVDCSCPKSRKIPAMELEFMLDQRSKSGISGRLQIGANDSAESGRMEISVQRRETRRKRPEMEATEAAEEQERYLKYRRGEEAWVQQQEEDKQGASPDSSDRDYTPAGPSDSSGNRTAAQNREHFPLTVLAAMRHGVSQRALANILSSYAVDMGLAKREDPRLLVDHSKVGREQDREMARVTASAETWIRTAGINGVQFDGRQDVTKAWITLEDGTKVVREVNEDHYTLTDSEGRFLTHFSKQKVEGVRPARVIADHIVDIMNNYGISDTLQMVGADSTNLNTGCNAGVITILERLLGRRLVWSICMLHTNELPLRHLIQRLDGPTVSGGGFSGPIGKLLPVTQDLPYNNQFTSLAVGEPLPELPQAVLDDLSWDQRYSYSMLKALEAGSVPPSLQRMAIGPVNHSRWLTTANRLLDLWTRQHGLTGEELVNLTHLCEFTVAIYLKQWFRIKRDRKLIDGARNLLKQVQLVEQYSPSAVQTIVRPYIGSFFAHPELLLLSMLASEDKEERACAVVIICQDIREGASAGSSLPRKFSAPSLNFAAQSLADLIDWDAVPLSEPLLTATLSTEQVEACRDTPLSVPPPAGTVTHRV